jgi:uracil-DNA glycosylase
LNPYFLYPEPAEGLFSSFYIHNSLPIPRDAALLGMTACIFYNPDPPSADGVCRETSFHYTIPMNVRLESSWKHALEQEFIKPYFVQLTNFVRSEYQTHTIYPPAPTIFTAFDACPFAQVKVVILGQDPYHGQNQANGLCFAVHEGVRLPPSLQNICKELQSDLNIPIATSGNLLCWAKQGVLLLNSVLTVQAEKAASHQGKGWEQFTDAAITALSQQRENIVFLLWGRYAHEKGKHIDTTKHLVLKAAHPSPLSAYNGFFGCKHFSKANEYLVSIGKEPIDWRVK